MPMSQADTERVDLEELESRAKCCPTCRTLGQHELEALIAELRQRRADSERLDSLEEFTHHTPYVSLLYGSNGYSLRGVSTGDARATYIGDATAEIEAAVAEATRPYKLRLLSAIEGKWPCDECGAQMTTDGEKLAGKCEECCPK